MSDTQDAQSPTTLIMNYLKSKGLPPNSSNIRAVLTENARNPGMIPGLQNSAPGEDSATPKARGPGVGQRGSAASRIENGGSKLPVPPIPPANGGDAKTTSAPPQADTSSGINWENALGLAGAGALGAGAMMIPRGGNGSGAGGGGEFVGNSGPPPFKPAAGPDMLTGPTSQPMIAADPMQAALAKATASPDAMPQLGGSVPPMPQIGADVGGGAMVPSSAIPMPDATSGPPLRMQDQGSGPPIATPRTQAPMPEPAATPGLMEDFVRFIRGIGARR